MRKKVEKSTSSPAITGNKLHGIFCFIGLGLNHQMKDTLSIWFIHKMWFITLYSKPEDTGWVI